MRDIIDVINQMKAVVPEQYHYAFDAVIKAAKYTAPEGMRPRWLDLTYFCNQLVPQEGGKDKWVWEMLSILTTKSVAQLKREEGIDG